MPAATIRQWRVTRASGESVLIEAETEREVQLLARESWPEDAGAFRTGLISSICAKCRTTVPVGGTCETCRGRRDQGQRTFIVRVAFLLNGGWTSTYEARIRAMGVTGATALGVREAKRAGVKRARGSPR